jgi:DNA-binding NarL/FixJ family response regulator
MDPGEAYRGLPDEVALAAAIVDSLIWDIPTWVADVAAYQEHTAEPPLIRSDSTEAIMAANGWASADAIYDAAGLTEKQRQAVALHLLGWDIPAIADELGANRWTTRHRVEDGRDRLHKLVVASKVVVSEGATWAPQVTYTRPKPPYLILTDRQMRSRREREIAAGAEFEAIPSAGRENGGRRLAR